MLKFGNKEFRNLQEQVYKNMHDILFILQEEGVLNEFGIKVVGQEESVANMPTVADYKENNPDWAYGDAYAIGTESPYTLYILTRANGTHADDYWFNIGSFPVPGPQGPEGPQGEVGPQGPTGNPGANGLDAGFGTISASAETVSSTDPATVTITTSGPNTAKNISFAFEIPQGEKGEDGAGEWGEITGDISNQTDLITALQGKQNTLVSGTNIKTISGQSILGSGNIDVSKLQATATVVIDALTNLNGRVLSNFEATLDTSTSYTYYIITRNGSQLTEEQAKDYMEYMTGSRFLPVFDYETPENSLFIFANGSLWKPQFDNVGLKLYALPNPYALKSELSAKQDTLVSGQNIKTINNESILGSGNITIQGGKPSVADFTAGPGIVIDEDLSHDTVSIEVDQESIPFKVDLATVAFSGSYNDLSNKPSIPSVSGTNDGTNWTSITINSDTYAIPSGAGTVTDVTVGGVSVLDGTVAKIPALFDGNYNSLTNKPDLSIYAQTADLGDCAFLDENEITIDYSQITGTPSIPTKTSDLTNDSGFITSAYHDATKQDVISDLATIRSGAALGATAVQPSAIEDMATKTWVGQQGYLTSVSWSDVSGKPTFATVATSGSYNDLSDKPSIPSSSDFVDVTSNQSVDGQKTFLQRDEFMSGVIIGYIGSSTGNYYYPGQITAYNSGLSGTGEINYLDIRTRGNTPAYITLYDYGDSSGPSISMCGNVNPASNSARDLGHSHAKWGNLYLSGNLSDGTNSVSIANIATKAEIPSVPVTDVTLGGVSVLSSGVAVLPAYPTVPTTVSSFTNDAGYITGITSSMVTTALGFTPLQSVTPTSETWTFTLDDDSTVTKTVVTAVTSA